MVGTKRLAALAALLVLGSVVPATTAAADGSVDHEEYVTVETGEDSISVAPATGGNTTASAQFGASSGLSDEHDR